MAPPSKKRSHSASDKPAGNSRPKRVKKANVVKPKPKFGKNVRLDDLAWKEVSMPDRLDDVEGFFGLEEVDDVEVVREDGAIKFIGAGDDESPEQDGDEAIDNAYDEEEDPEEWGGIDDIITTAEPESTEAKTLSPALTRPKSAFKKTKLTPNPSVADHELSTFSFSFLNSETTEEDIALPAWSPMHLSTSTLCALARLKFTHPTPIQSSAIPLILSGSSLIGKASTGSGKTLAFGIPILETYLSSLPTTTDSNPTTGKAILSKDRKLTALIIAPTRELAHQIAKHLTELCYYTDLKLVTITGGLSVQKQQRLLDNGVDVIVATPGRLWEIVSEGQGWVEKLRNVKMLVLDEADRVLEEGHFKEVTQILSLMDAESGDSSDEESDEEDAKEKVFGGGSKKKKQERQTLVFSATFHKSLQQKLSGKSSKNSWSSSGNGGDLLSSSESMEYLFKKLKFKQKPEWVDVDPLHAVAQKVKEGIVECGNMEKDLYLYYLLLRYPSRTLIFTNSITSVKRLVPMLNHLLSTSSSEGEEGGNRVFPLHSQLPQKSRLRSIERFSGLLHPKLNDKNYQTPILVATDVAARGLDIPSVSLVIHYHLPRTADMYVHRSGRTGRASATSNPATFGSSIILCAPGEAAAMARLVGKIHVDTNTAGKGGQLTSIDVDRNIIPKIRKRVDLAKKISDAHIVKQKLSKDEDWLRSAAEDLGIDISDSEIAKISGRDKKGDRRGRGEEWDDGAEEGDEGGRGSGAGTSKEEIEKWKWELKAELGKKVNLGFSMRYLTSGVGGVNLADHLLRGRGHGGILGAERREVLEEMMRYSGLDIGPSIIRSHLQLAIASHVAAVPGIFPEPIRPLYLKPEFQFRTEKLRMSIVYSWIARMTSTVLNFSAQRMAPAMKWMQMARGRKARSIVTAGVFECLDDGSE
ncbi:P-loop containing nucleoside triphosphate hydrolase protein [Terfezia claveryi]|nr:P-loop containing nucleoside triphosphate hydrolase protein [Terfezia claveryi]